MLAQISSYSGLAFSADFTNKFLKTWVVSHRVSAAYNPHSNGRAEVAVKTAKCLMGSNMGTFETLDSDKFLLVMLQLRNSPDPDCRISPAEIVFGLRLRDNLVFADYSNHNQCNIPVGDRRHGMPGSNHSRPDMFEQQSRSTNTHDHFHYG